MRVGIISDIHVDINQAYDIRGELCRILEEKEVDRLLIAGDITSDPDQTLTWIHQFQEKSNREIYFVPGNHDLWNGSHKYQSTDEIYQLLAKDAACICNRDVILGDYVLIGDVCWYDYSFGNHEKYTIQDFEKMTRNGRTWQDSLFNDWAKENAKTSDAFIQKLEARIKKIREKDKTRKIILMTHMISNQMYKVPEEIGDWSYFNAFLGTQKLENLCVEHKIAIAICGHVHYRHTEKKDGVVWMCRCLNYHTEWQGSKQIREQLLDAIEIIEC